MFIQALLIPKPMILAAAVFGLVLSIWMIVVLALSTRRAERDKAVAQRLGEIETGDDSVRVLRLWADGQEATTIVPKTARIRHAWLAFSRFPEDAGWSSPAHSILLMLAGIALAGALMTWTLTLNLIPAAGVAVAIVALFIVYTRYRIDQNTARFERQFSEALQLLARSLRAGHPLTGAFRLTAEEMQPPVSHIFARICQEQSLGMDIEQSLRDVSEESNSADLKLFATSVAIQIRTGGNLADMMDRLAQVIRARIRLSQRVRVVSAQTQLSKRILLAMPLLMLLALSILNPAHMMPLWETPLGNAMLVGAGVAMLLGWFTMNQMAKIKY